MADRLDVVVATLGAAEELAPRIREADAAEVWASGGRDPRTALLESLAVSLESYSALVDGELAAIFGVALMPGSSPRRVGVPWLLGSPLIEKYPKAFHSAARLFVDAWLVRYGELEQMVDARHVRSLRWLRHLGFRIDEPRLWGYERRPFCRVHLSGVDRV